MAFLGVYGHVNVDHILLVPELPGPERTVSVKQSLIRLGGTGGNIARAAASLGVSTSLAACVGDDFPDEYRHLLESSGLDLTDLKHVPGPTPKIWIVSVPGGAQNAIIDQGVMGDSFERPKLDFAWLNSDWVHFTTGAPADWLEPAQAASQAGKRIAFDPAQELAYRYTSRVFETLLNDSDLFVCNEHELPRALDLLGYGDARQLFDHTDRILVTRGERGARLIQPKETLDVAACPVRGSKRVESTGAGDVFRAGLYAGLFRSEPWPEALRAASVAASLFLENEGNRFPSWSDVVERREEWTT